MAEKEQAIADLAQSYTDFRERIASLPDDAYRETWLGEWSLEQLLAHMAGWWREMSGAFPRVAAGGRPAPEGVDYSDADTWNAKFAAGSKQGQAALDDWDEAFHEYYAAAQGLDASFYGVDPEKGRPRIGNRLLAASGLDHFAEHRPQLESWLRSRAG
jgi:hypothetical protein